MKYLLWIALFCLCAQANAQTVAEDIKAGRKLLDDDRPEDALKRFNHALSVNPKSLDALYSRGVARAQVHKSADAVDDLTIVVRSQPREPFARYWRGVAYGQQQKRVEAIEDFSVALGTNKPLPADLRYCAYLYRGLNRNDLGQLSAARTDLDDAIQIDPSQAEGWAGRARIRRAQGDETGAQSDLARAAQIDPDLGQLLDSDSHIHLTRIILWVVILVVCGFILATAGPLFRALAVLTKEEKK